MDLQAFREIIGKLEAILTAQNQILAILTAKRLVIRIGKHMANFQLGDSLEVPFGIVLLDAKGFPDTLPDHWSVTVTSSAPASLAVVLDATPAAGTIVSGKFVGGTPQAGVIVTALAGTFTPGGPSIESTDTIDVVGGAPATMGFQLGTPVPQGGSTPPPAGP